MQTAAGDGPEVVVFDQQRVGELLQHGAELACAVGVERGAGGVLPARRDDHGDGAARERPLELGCEHSAVVDDYGLEREALRAQQVVQRGVAGVLDRYAVARSQVRAEHTLDRVHGAAEHAHVLGGDAVCVQLLARELEQRGQRLALAVETRGQRRSPHGTVEIG